MPDDGMPRPNNHFTLKIGGKEGIGKFREVTGLDAESEVIEQKESAVGGNGHTVIRKVSGSMKWSNIELKRGIDSSGDLWQWRKVVEEQGPDTARTDCELILNNYDGSPIAHWNIKQAWPSKYTGASLNAGANEIAVEGVTLVHEGLERV
jgi:phage tail-like protein